MKSTAASPAIVAILFLSFVVCILALIWLPIKGIGWLYNSRVAAQKQAVAAGQQWMHEVGEAFAPIPVEKEAVVVAQAVTVQEVSVVEDVEVNVAAEVPIEEASTPTTVELDLQQVI